MAAKFSSFSWRLALAIGLLAGGALPSFAQSNCKAEISATGSASLTQKGAEDRAISNWRRTVVLRYGEVYATFDKAQGKSVDRCGKTILGLTRCEARGRPCDTPTEGSASFGGSEIACNSRRDSKNCEPLVKWVQARLNAKLGTNLKVDGAAGEQTAQALRRFQRQNNLGASGEIDERLLTALR